MCFIFLESSLKTSDTWRRIPPRSGSSRREGKPALQENTTGCDTHTRIDRGFYRWMQTLVEAGESEGEGGGQTLGDTKDGRPGGEGSVAEGGSHPGVWKSFQHRPGMPLSSVDK